MNLKEEPPALQQAAQCLKDLSGQAMNYIMPSIPPMPPIGGTAGLSSGMSATMQSVVRIRLDEDSPGAIRLFPLVRDPGKIKEETVVQYNDSYDWPAQPPVGIYFNYGLVDEFMHEWLLRQQELDAGEITRDEYFEWKLNWPRTCDDCGKCEPSIPWRKNE